MDYEKALPITQEFCGMISTYCENLVICGSLRRRETIIDSVDVVVVHKDNYEEKDLFGEVTKSYNQLWNRLDQYVKIGVVFNEKDGNKVWGNQHRRLWFKGLWIDIYSSEPHNLGYEKMLRTGGNAFSKFMTTSREEGGAVPEEMMVAGGRLFRNNVIVCVETERDYFHEVGVTYMTPWERGGDEMAAFRKYLLKV